MLVPALQELISSYLAASPARTHESLASRSAVSSKTIQRILNEGYSPTPKTVLCLIKVLFNNDEARMLNFLTEHMPDRVKHISRFFKKSEADLTNHNTALSILTDNPVSFLTGTLLTQEKGVTRDFLRSHVGNKSISVLDELMEEGHIIEVSPGHFRFRENRIGTFDGHTLKSLVRHDIEQYDPKIFGTDKGFIHHASRFVNKEARAKIREILAKAGAEIADLCEANPGDVPVAVFSGMVQLIDIEGEGA